MLCVCVFVVCFLNEVGIFCMCVLMCLSLSKHKTRLFARLDLVVWFHFVCLLVLVF